MPSKQFKTDGKCRFLFAINTIIPEVATKKIIKYVITI
jgi:hypothetical protein